MSRLTAVLWLSCLPLAAAAEPIRLNTDIFPPYQVQEGDQLGGSSVVALECIFSNLQEPYRIRVMPWERAIHEVSQDNADGFFSAMHMRRANEFAQLSAPLALEKWYWYSNDPQRPTSTDGAPRQPPRLGGIRGSNQVAWLEQQGFRVDPLVSNTQQLLRLLELERIDAFLADQRTLRIELTQLPLGLRPAHEHFQQYSTLGVYFSQAFLERKPGFLTRFNQQVFHCIPEIAVLTGQERDRLLELQGALFSQWPARTELIEAVTQQNQQHQALAINDIMRLDRQWIAEAPQNERPLIDRVLGHSLSQWLIAQQERHDGLITEIMVTDRHGLNVAISEVTTDYWQGDESKFSEAFFAATDTPYLGQLDYDQSTQSYQVHISSQIRDPRRGNVIGVLIIGLDIERALRMNGLPGVK